MLTAAQINQMGTLMLRGDADTPGDVSGADTSACVLVGNLVRMSNGGTLLDNANGPFGKRLRRSSTSTPRRAAFGSDLNSTVDLLDAPASNQVFAVGLIAPVPAPIAGAGIPGMISGSVYSPSMGRRRRASALAAA